MSVLAEIGKALSPSSGIDFDIGKGKYTGSADPRGKIVFTGKEKSIQYMVGVETQVETFKVVIRSGDYSELEEKASLVKSALKSAGFIQTGGYEDETKDGDNFMQLAVNFKTIM